MFLYFIALITVVVIFPLTQAPPLQPFSSNSIFALCVCEFVDYHDVASFECCAHVRTVREHLRSRAKSDARKRQARPWFGDRSS